MTITNKKNYFSIQGIPNDAVVLDGYCDDGYHADGTFNEDCSDGYCVEGYYVENTDIVEKYGRLAAGIVICQGGTCQVCTAGGSILNLPALPDGGKWDLQINRIWPSQGTADDIVLVFNSPTQK
jgi:hypothetical protein